VIYASALESVPQDIDGTVVTIGKFDGVHLGHQALLAQTIDLAEDAGLASAVLTFDRHPARLLTPSQAPLPIIGTNQKRHLLAEAGIDLEVELAFDQVLSEMTPTDFVHLILVERLKAKTVVVGADFRFGQNGAGDVDTLRALGKEVGFRVSVIPEQRLSGEKVSSTRIRALLDSGDVVAAAELLGRPHLTTGIVEHGLKIGRQIGFPTANMSRDAEGYLPRDGVYAGWLYAGEERYPAALSVGINDTVQAVPRLIEAYVLDRTDLDLYDQIVTLEYVDFVRPAAKFDGLEALVEAIKADVERIREILS
jgi:riboflavin kinase/FMN adenylyltransferase